MVKKIKCYNPDFKTMLSGSRNHGYFFHNKKICRKCNADKVFMEKMKYEQMKLYRSRNFIE